MESTEMELMTVLEGSSGDTDIGNLDLWTQQGKQRVGRTERATLSHTHYYM